MKNRNYNIDLLRIIACVGVVLLHTIGFKNESLLYYLGTISIPLFFMISGYCILQKDSISKKYVFTKVINIIILILIWSILFGILHAIRGKNECNFVNILIGSFNQKRDLALLWFLWAIMIMYMISPILHKIFQSKYDKLLLAILLIISTSIFLLNIFLKIKYDFIIQDKVIQTLRIWTWITYFYLGAMIEKYHLYFTKISKNSYIKIGICLAISIIYEYVIAKYIFIDMRCENFYDSTIIKILSFLVFEQGLNINVKEKYNNIIIMLSKATLGVYILQIICLKIVEKIYHWENNVLNIVIFIMLTFTLFACSIGINKIKGLKKIINTDFVKI